MALDFPSSVSTGTTFVGQNGITYLYDGRKWTATGNPTLTLDRIITDTASAILDTDDILKVTGGLSVESVDSSILLNAPAGSILLDSSSTSTTTGVFSQISLEATTGGINLISGDDNSLSRIHMSSTGTSLTGNFLPQINLAFDLGSPSRQWRSLYVGTSTIYLGGTALSISGGNLTVNGSPVAVGNGYTGSQGNIGYTGSQGTTGYAGSRGALGFTGSKGDTGYAGSQGDIGYAGSRGTEGFVGSRGIDGFTGSQGDIGYAGSRGSLGYTGSRGDTGYDGSKGDIGYAGSQGDLGYTGSRGVDGYVGSQGDIGFTGSQGTSGLQGNRGYTGSEGPQGNPGLQGETGAQGISIVLVGSTDTVTTSTVGLGTAGQGWINTTDGDVYFWNTLTTNWENIGPIVGPQGDLGYTGSQGDQGNIGLTGDPGYTGSQGDVGYVGSQGDVGYVGSQGELGYTGSQGDLGYVGSQGETGYAGSQGELGYTGSQGDVGYVGSQGETGYTGSQGDLGYVGSQGDVGYVGSQGDLGYTGSQGELGYTGSQGDLGYTGSSGIDTTSTLYSGTLTVSMNVSGDLIPSTDIQQDLGSTTNRFRHVYVGPGSVYIGNNVITESATGNLVLPGVTRATGYYAEEVEDDDDWGSNPAITGTVTVIDASRYRIISGRPASANYSPATYTAQKDGNRVDEINVTSGGSGWDKVEADYARDNNMYATNVAGAINTFNAGDWTQIPFRVEIKAEDTEYEDIFGGSGDRLVNGDHQVVLGSTGVLTFPTGGQIANYPDGVGASNNSWFVTPGGENGNGGVSSQDGQQYIQINNNLSVEIGTSYGTANQSIWRFNTDGDLTLPAGGDILNSSGQSVLGGGASSSTLVNGDFVVGLQVNGSLLLPTGDYQENQSRYQGAIISENESSAIYMDVQTNSQDNVYGGIRLETWNSVPIDIRTRAGGQGDDIKNWRFDSNGSITFPDDTVQTTAYTGQTSGDTVVTVSDTAPTATTGTQWFNTVEGRTYIAYNGVWVDASPLMMPAPDTDIDVVSITFPDASVQTTAFTGVSSASTHIEYTDGQSQYTSTVDLGYNFEVDTHYAHLNINGNGDWEIGSNNFDTKIFSTDDPGNEPKVIVVRAGNDDWTFGPMGLLTLPGGSQINDGLGVIRLAPSGASSSTQALEIYPTAGDGNHIHLTAGGGETDLYLGNDIQYVKVDHGGAIVVGTVGANTSTWTFGTDGNLTLPLDSSIHTVGDESSARLSWWPTGGDGGSTETAVIVSSNGVSILTDAPSNENTWLFGTDGLLTLPSGNIRIGNAFGADAIMANTGTNFGIVSQGSGSSILQWIDDISDSTAIAGIAVNSMYSSTGSVQIYTGAVGPTPQHAWTFAADGSITFPDATVQTTAFVQGEQIFTVNTGTTAYAPTAVDFNLLFVTSAIGYSETDPISVTLPNGVPGQRLVIFNGYNLAPLTVNPGPVGRDISSGIVAEFIYSGFDGLWMPLYGTNSPT